MRFEYWDDSIDFSLSEAVVRCREYGEADGYKRLAYRLLMDTLNGRNDFHLVGVTPDEVVRLISRIAKRL